MATVTELDIRTVADLIQRLGDVSPSRIRLQPPLGTATKKDLLALDKNAQRRCELVDGVLVEKPMGPLESLVAVTIARLLANFVDPRDLGFVAGPDGTVELWEGLVRIPDVAFIAKGRLSVRDLQTQAIPLIAPDLAVEILSRTNTRGEMERKRSEYFESGVRLVWIVDHTARSVHVYRSLEDHELLTTNETLDGGDVLPGFSVAVSELFVKLD